MGREEGTYFLTFLCSSWMTDDRDRRKSPAQNGHHIWHFQSHQKLGRKTRLCSLRCHRRNRHQGETNPRAQHSSDKCEPQESLEADDHSYAGEGSPWAPADRRFLKGGIPASYCRHQGTWGPVPSGNQREKGKDNKPTIWCSGTAHSMWTAFCLYLEKPPERVLTRHTSGTF